MTCEAGVTEAASADLEQRVESGAEQLANRAQEFGKELTEASRAADPRLRNWIGAGLVLFGGFLLMRSLDISWLRWLDFDLLWPILLIVAGALMLFRRGREVSE